MRVCDRHTETLIEAEQYVVVLPIKLSLSEASKMIPSQLGTRELCLRCAITLNRWLDQKDSPIPFQFAGQPPGMQTRTEKEGDENATASQG